MKTRYTGLVVVVALTLIGAAFFMGGAGANVSESSGNDQLSQAQIQPQQQLFNTSFGVTDLSAPEDTTAGETIVVSANVTNPADTPMIQFVELRLDGDVVDRRAFALNPGETETVTFEFNTTGVDPGTHVHSVQTQDSGEVGTIEVTEAATGTETPTETATATATETPTATPTETPTGNETETATATETATETQTATETETAT